jgi:hypothetical protein
MGSRASCFAPQARGEEKATQVYIFSTPRSIPTLLKMGSRSSCFAPPAEGAETTVALECEVELLTMLFRCS